MLIDGHEITRKTHNDYIRSIIFQLIDIAEFDVEEVKKGYQLYKKTENQQEDYLPIL